MTPLTVQQRIDQTGLLDLPPGETRLDYPLFLESGSEVRGRPDARVSCSQSGIGFVVGWKRGLVSNSHWTAGIGGMGFRTFGDSYLRGHGTPWDQGVGPAGNWGSLTAFDLTINCTLRSGPNWSGIPLCGVQALAASGVYGPAPSPWLLYWDGPVLTLALGYADGSTEYHQFADYSPTSTDLAFRQRIELNRPLAENTMWPFSLGRIDPLCAAAGYWGGDGPWQDIEFRQFVLKTQAHFVMNSSSDFLQPDLPTFPTWHSAGGRGYLMAVHKNQSSGMAGDVLLRDVRLVGQSGCPNVLMGGVQGGLRLERCNFQGGSMGLSSSGAGVVYPVTVVGSTMAHHALTGLHVHRDGWLAVRDSVLNYGRSALLLVGCYGVVDNVLVTPPGPPAQPIVIEQRGGFVDYRRVRADYEYTPGPSALIRLTPETWDQGYFTSGCRVSDCTTALRGTPLVRIEKPHAGYTSPTSVFISTHDPLDAVVEGPGLSFCVVKNDLPAPPPIPPAQT